MDVIKVTAIPLEGDTRGIEQDLYLRLDAIQVMTKPQTGHIVVKSEKGKIIYQGSYGFVQLWNFSFYIEQAQYRKIEIALQCPVNKDVLKRIMGLERTVNVLEDMTKGIEPEVSYSPSRNY